MAPKSCLTVGGARVPKKLFKGWGCKGADPRNQWPRHVSKWLPSGAQMVPRWTQYNSRWSQDGPKMAPRWSQDGPETDPTWSANGPQNYHRGVATSSQYVSKVVTGWSQKCQKPFQNLSKMIEFTSTSHRATPKKSTQPNNSLLVGSPPFVP